MDPSWKHADIFPIIARVIEQEYREGLRFVTAQEIAVRLLQDREGRHLVQTASDQQKNKRPVEWMAGNMVSWFSQRITVGESHWAGMFEREKIDGRWAYRPSSGHTPDRVGS